MNLTEFEPDIERLVENTFLGPQAEVLELIQTFNETYVNVHDNYNFYRNINAKLLGITKKFYWKPGCYDTIRKIITRVTEMNRKAQSITKLLARAKDNMNWRLRDILLRLSEIEGKLIRFRQDGALFQDNSEEITEYWNLFRNKLIEQEELNDYAIFSVEEVIVNEELTDYHINVTYSYNNPVISYRDYDHPESLADIHCSGEIKITVKLILSKFINAIASSGSLENISIINSTNGHNNRKASFFIGGNYENNYDLLHPFISRSPNYWHNRETNMFNNDFKYVCVGNLSNEIFGCIKSLDFLSLKIFIDRLVLHYDTNTGPLNRITFSYFGHPTFLEGNGDYYSRVGATDINNCRYIPQLRRFDDDGESVQWIKDNSYCNKYCAAKTNCDTYQRVTKELSPEQIETRALEQATINAARRIQ